MAAFCHQCPVLVALPEPSAAVLNATPTPQRLLPPLLGGVTLLWLFWPLLLPRLAPARVRGATLVVVFDGYHRLDVALARTGASPVLLISCPLTGQPTPAQRLRARGRPFWVDRRGEDSARQLTTLADWLQHAPADLPPIGRVLLVSDSHHLPRLLPAARLALGSRGLAVSGLVANADWPSSRRLPPPGPWPITRDWLRLQLWRATGSTGVFLFPAVQSRKHRECG